MSVLPMASTPVPPTETAPRTEPEQRTVAPAGHPAAVLITEQEVLLGSALAGGSAPAPAPRWPATFRRIFAPASGVQRGPKRRSYPSQCAYLEDSRMSREMWRL
ncbi:hypothetical protein BH09ACT8_BH09ACT8_26870 [soil metagenome]